MRYELVWGRENGWIVADRGGYKPHQTVVCRIGLPVTSYHSSSTRITIRIMLQLWGMDIKTLYLVPF